VVNILRWLATVLLLATTLASTGVAQAQSQTGSALATTSDRAPESPDLQLQTAEQAYTLLVDHFEHPLASSALLRAGWDQLTTDAADHKVPPPGALQILTGDRAADWEAVRAALSAYLSRPGTTLDTFTPAYAFIRGMVHFVDEGHTYFLDPQQYRDYQSWSRGDNTYVGIGISVSIRGPEPRIVQVFEGTPAEQAGLQRGDTLVRIDGKPVAGVHLDELTTLMRGPAGMPVQLTIRRGDDAQLFTVTIVRAEIHLQFVQERMIDDDIGYVLLRGFPEPSVADTLEQDIEGFEQQGVRGLVLDLRGNSGGRLDVGIRLLSHFLPAGTSIYEEIDRSGHDRLRYSRSGLEQFDIPLVVLVDGGTASMGEIFASAVQEHGAATIVGTTTAGSVAAAEIFGLPDGAGLQVTVYDIRAADGKELNRVGVAPDDVVDTEIDQLASGDDPVLSRAVDILRNGGG
jgi:carboxyl-terminal processing protease